MGLAAGTKLGAYEIVATLGAGGMGEVYRARDTALKREVAIKILPRSYSADPERLRRFQQEAEAAASLNHPNILVVHQVGQQDGTPYIVTELLQGETLRERLRGGPPPLRTAINYAVQIAHGLATAHEKGIVHRDLKPENLFVTRDGRIKILDFGLAKLTQPEPTSEPNQPTISEKTAPGAVMGTAGYMSPEQVRGQSTDQRSDIFAFGAILYEMLAGKRAFQGVTSADTMSAVLTKDPPELAIVRTDLPPALQRMVQRCLQKNPEQRFQSISDLAFALEALTDIPSARHQTLAADPRKWGWVKWAAVPTLVVIAAIGFYLRRSSSASFSGGSAPSLDVRVLTESGKAFRAAASPDGRYVAYVNKDDGKFELRLLQVATERDVTLLSAPLSIRSLHFSPDGNFIYFLRQLTPGEDDALGVFRIATLGGPATPLATDARMYSITVSPDGKQVAYIAWTKNESQIVAVDPDGSNRHILTKRPLELGFWFIEWSPTADAIAAVAIGKEDMGLVSVELPAGTIRELSVTGWKAVGQPAWGPDGTIIFCPAVAVAQSTFQIWAFDAHTGAHRPLTAGSTDYSEWSLSATAAGDLIANTSTPSFTIWATDQSNQLHPTASLRNEGYDSVIWVDGRIVTSNIDEMMAHGVDGGNPTKLRSYSQIYRQLARCGPQQVAYWAVDAEHQSHIARTDITTGSTSRLTDGPLDEQPTCTADGLIVVFLHCTDQGGHCFVTRRSVASGEAANLYEIPRIATAPDPRPALSPDGTQVLFAAQDDVDARDSKVSAEIVPIAGGSPLKVMSIAAGRVIGFAWAADGKSILHARNEHGVGNIWSVPVAGGGAKKVTNFTSDDIYAFGVSPDSRLAVSRGSFNNDVVLIKNAK